METKPGGFTIKTNTTEEVTVNTTATDETLPLDDINALREQIASLKEVVLGLASAVADKEAAEPVSHDSDTSGHEDEPIVVEPEPPALTATHGDADAHGFVPSTVEVVRPDAPPEPEPEPVVTTADVDTSGVDEDAYPKMVSGVRPSEDTNIYMPARLSARRGNHAVAAGLGAYAKWAVARGVSHTGITISDRSPSMCLLDWIAYAANTRMTKPQVRTALLRMEKGGHVSRALGKRGKQDLWTIDPNGAYNGYLS